MNPKCVYSFASRSESSGVLLILVSLCMRSPSVFSDERHNEHHQAKQYAFSPGLLQRSSIMTLEEECYETKTWTLMEGLCR